MPKIVHVMISCFYVEGAGYQENILPRKHKQLGYDVSIISKSTYYDKNGNPNRREPCSYINNDDIPVTILPDNTKRFWSKISRCRLSFLDKVTVGLYDRLEYEKPDIIFEHGLSTSDTIDIAIYTKRHDGVKLFIDQHGDYYNTPIHSDSFIDSILLFLRHKVYLRFIVKKIHPYVSYFWGTTPWRVQYLREVYHVPDYKSGLLVMGGDDSYIHWNNKEQIRNKLRSEQNISSNDFVIISGGKIDKTKNIHLLVEAIQNLKTSKVKLLLFGSPTKEMHPFFNKKHDNVINIGWLDSNSVYDWFLAADLAVFPGTHSVLWEQAAATGIPLMCKYWEGMQHVNRNGNCLFIHDINIESLTNSLQDIICDREHYAALKSNATNVMSYFQYSTIAKQSVAK